MISYILKYLKIFFYIENLTYKKSIICILFLKIIQNEYNKYFNISNNIYYLIYLFFKTIILTIIYSFK